MLVHQLTPFWLAPETVRREFLAVEVIAARSAKLFELTEGRNAWGSTWAEARCGMFSTLERAKREAERRRTMGTSWAIVEVPALAFCGESEALLMSEPGAKSPLSGVRGSWPPKASVAAVLRCFGERRCSLHLAPADSLTLDATACRTYCSESQGGRYFLRWLPFSGEQDSEGIFAIAAAFERRSSE